MCYMVQDIKFLLHEFDSISLIEMEQSALMKRSDTKFLVPINQFPDIIKKLKDDYFILEINQNRLMTYHSLYFDTPEFKFYHDHHNKKSNRTKIRFRQYVESNLSFLEIKQKNGKGITQKIRMKVDSLNTQTNQQQQEFIQENTQQKLNLKHSLTNRFQRITFVNKKAKERVTFDFNISFTMDTTSDIWNHIVVVEVKQEKETSATHIREVLKQFHYYPFSISKYCMGVVKLYPHIKYNRFKQKILKLNKIQQR